MNKILFLDIDGVLNSIKSAELNHSWEVLDQTALVYIDYLQKHGVNIVVSSSWRRFKTKSELCDILGIWITAVTPAFNENVSRGFEINAWLTANGNPEYCIIDDDSDMLPEQLQRFVKTDVQTGMQLEHFKRICDILNIDYPLLVDVK